MTQNRITRLLFFGAKLSHFQFQHAENAPGEGCGEEEVPEERHREILEDRAQPNGRQLQPGCAAQNDAEEDGGHQTHGRAHDGHCAALTEKLAEIGIVLFRIAVAGGEGSTELVSPQVGKQEHEETHIQPFLERFPEHDVGHIAEAACLQGESQLAGHVIDFHPECHGIGHEQSEDNALRFRLNHDDYLLKKRKRILPGRT